VFEYDPEFKMRIKWCPGFGDKWRWNINLGGAFDHGVWGHKGLMGRVKKFINKMTYNDPRHDNFIPLR